MKVPTELIPNHATVFEFNTVRLIGAIMAITGALERDSTTTLVREEGLHPIELVIRPSGGLIILDRDRRVYMVDGDSEPRSPGCIPQAVDAAYRIGLAFDDRGGHAVVNRPVKPGGPPRFGTEVLDIRLTETGPLIANRTVLAGRRRFAAAAFDFSRNRVFLASPTKAEIYAADLDRPRREPELFARFPGSGPIRALGFDTVHGRLFAAHGETGALFAVDARDEKHGTNAIAQRMGGPRSLSVDSARGVVYVVDARNGKVWSTRCLYGETCSPPTSLLESGVLQNPSFVTVAPDGTVWLAGLEDQRVVAVEPSGKVRRVIGR